MDPFETASAEPNSPRELSHLESELRVTLEENARLQNALADANMRILTLQNMQQPPTGITGAEVYRSLISELQQPLTTINSFCDILLQESVGILGSLQRKFIERIQHAAYSMSILIEDLSRYAGRETSSGTYEVETIHLVDLCNSILNSFSAQLLEKEVTLSLDIEDTLPLVSADRQDLEQTIRLMIRNAILAAPEEGLVEISLKQDPDSRNKAVILSVFNSGKGIKEIDITRLFTTIVPEADSKIIGLGIDQKEFSILKMLVEEMDDTLNIVSDPVEGTSFVLKIPLR